MSASSRAPRSIFIVDVHGLAASPFGEVLRAVRELLSMIGALLAGVR